MHYGSECQLYALYAEKLPITSSDSPYRSKHVYLMRNYFCMFPIFFFGVIWFGNNGFRPLIPGSEHPWWNFLNYYLKPCIVPADYRKAHLLLSLNARKRIVKICYYLDRQLQSILFKILSI